MREKTSSGRTLCLLILGRIGKLTDQVRRLLVPVGQVLGAHGRCFVAHLASFRLLDSRDDNVDSFLLLLLQHRDDTADSAISELACHIHATPVPEYREMVSQLPAQRLAL